MRFVAPLLVFLVLCGFLYKGLSLNPRDIPSPLIDKPAPAFDLPLLQKEGAHMGTADLRGQVWLLNVWASWCVSCRQEHPLLVQLARQKKVPLYGLNYKDDTRDAIGWLQQHGNPYTRTLVDADGRVGINYGVYGVPETYLIDKKGIIRYKQTGPVTRDALQKHILPLVQQLQQES